MATPSSIFAWKIPWTEEPGGATVHGATESDMTEHAHTFLTGCMTLYIQEHLLVENACLKCLA